MSKKRREKNGHRTFTLCSRQHFPASLNNGLQYLQCIVLGLLALWILQYCVDSCPCVRMLLQRSQHFLCQTLLHIRHLHKHQSLAQIYRNIITSATLTQIRSPADARIADRTGCQWPSRSHKVNDFHFIWKGVCHLKMFPLH